MDIVRRHESHWRAYVASGGLVLILGVELLASRASLPQVEPPTRSALKVAKNDQIKRRSVEQGPRYRSEPFQVAAANQASLKAQDNNRGDHRISDRNSQVEPPQDGWDTVWAGITAIATIILTFATCLLAAFTYKLWSTTSETISETKKSLKHAETAATAATRQADLTERSIVAVERPYIFVENITIHRQPKNGGLTGYRGEPLPGQESFAFAQYDLTNYGRTPAIVQEACLGLLFSNGFPAEPDYKQKNGVMGNVFLAETKRTKTCQTSQIEELIFQYNCIECPDIPDFFFYGFIKYADMLGYIYIRKVAIAIVPGGRYINVPGKDYNLEKRYEPENPPDVRL